VPAPMPIFCSAPGFVEVGGRSEGLMKADCLGFRTAVDAPQCVQPSAFPSAFRREAAPKAICSWGRDRGRGFMPDASHASQVMRLQGGNQKGPLPSCSLCSVDSVPLLPLLSMASTLPLCPSLSSCCPPSGEDLGGGNRFASCKRQAGSISPLPLQSSPATERPRHTSSTSKMPDELG
jgi:hypothetical protein